MDILVTNDDGIDAPGIRAIARALTALGAVSVVAPRTNQSAVARKITLLPEIQVDEVAIDGVGTGFAVHGTPVDCVRFADIGLLGARPDLIVSGINHGVNLGDDVTYSGTVAAAFEGLLLGIPSIAVSQQPRGAGFGYSHDGDYDFEPCARFVARLVPPLLAAGFPAGNMLNVNCPARITAGARLTRLGKRIYRDSLEQTRREGAARFYAIYGDDATYHPEQGTDFAAIADGAIAITPLHFDLGAPLDGRHLAGIDLMAIADA